MSKAQRELAAAARPVQATARRYAGRDQRAFVLVQRELQQLRSDKTDRAALAGLPHRPGRPAEQRQLAHPRRPSPRLGSQRAPMSNPHPRPSPPGRWLPCGRGTGAARRWEGDSEAWSPARAAPCPEQRELQGTASPAGSCQCSRRCRERSHRAAGRRDAGCRAGRTHVAGALQPLLKRR